ncbi:hypothetical protein [Hydrogenophaga sp.]|uniref:hypothetical protein n=1 Tax=Hydrogenophaga sp. TaxID=1904254 RepID=UPI0035664655
MAQVYASAVFSSKSFDINTLRLRRLAGDRRTPAWSQHIERAHRCALAFCLNGFYAASLRVEHLLSARFQPSADLPEIWSDWTLIEDKRLGISTLHIAFAFSALQIDLDDPRSGAVENVAAFLAQVYQLSERESHLMGGLGELSRVLRGAANHRRNALGVSRYIYTSLICDQPEHVKAPTPDVKLNLYRLLFQHARGVDQDVANRMLPEAWGSAAFFRLYHQPGGMLSVSLPYPSDVHATHRDWFVPEAPVLAAMPFSVEPGADRYPHYDLLPEYPPLRYLAMPALVYTATFEETLREVHEAAFGRWFLQLTLPWQTRPAARHLLAANLEGLRLPVARDLVHRMLEKQLQDRTTHASMEMLRMRESARNLLLAVLAIILTIVFADFGNSQRNLEQLLKRIERTQAVQAGPVPPPTKPIE